MRVFFQKRIIISVGNFPTSYGITIIALLVIFLSTNALIFSQSIILKGQFWGSVMHGDDPPISRSSFETTLGYIPMLSLVRNLSNDRFVDLEWGYRMGKVYAGNMLLIVLKNLTGCGCVIPATELRLVWACRRLPSGPPWYFARWPGLIRLIPRILPARLMQ